MQTGRALIIALAVLWVVSCMNIQMLYALEEIVFVKASEGILEVARGDIAELNVTVKVEDDWHINNLKPLQEFLIPTSLDIDTEEDIEVIEIVFPDPESVKFSFLDTPVLVYSHTFTVTAKIRIKKEKAPGDVSIKARLNYQGCNDKTCLPPNSAEFLWSLKILDTVIETPDTQENNDLESEKAMLTTRVDEESPELELTSDEKLEKEKLDKGIFSAILSFFISGLLLNLTPCVYPVIPITISFFGSQSEKSKGSGLAVALAYMMGIAIVFTMLGLVSSIAGKQWGFLFQNTWFVVVLSMIMFSLAASMFGVFEIRIPTKIMNSLGQSRDGLPGAFIMGLTVGVVIAPCAAGFIIGLIGLVAKMGLIVKGTILFFFTGLGLGLPYLFLAMFSGLMNNLPRSGMWMIWVRKFFGMVLIGIAFYFISPHLSRLPDQKIFFFGLVSLFSGLYLGFLDHNPGYSKKFNIGRAIFGIALILGGGFFVNNSISAETDLTRQGHKKSPVNWQYYSDSSFEELQSQKKPIFIDFYAEWCAPCRKMDYTTFADPAVVKKSKEFTMIKVDCTKPNVQVKAFMKKHNAVGMPTLVFLDKNGRELPELRSGEFIDSEEFLKRAAQAGK